MILYRARGAGFFKMKLVISCSALWLTLLSCLYGQMIPANGSPGMRPKQEVVVLSSPKATGAGYFSIFDQAGDSLMYQQSLGNNPLVFTLDATGSYSNTTNADGTSDYFPIKLSSSGWSGTTGSNTMIQGSIISGIFSPGNVEYVLDVAHNTVNVGTCGQGCNPGEFSFTLQIPVAPTPVSMAGLPYGAAGLQRFFVVSQNIPYGVACNNDPSSITTAGEAAAIEVATNSVSAKIPVGSCPVYALSSTDGKRVFVLNRGSDSITVINAVSNSLNTCKPFVSSSGQNVSCHPSIALFPASGETHAGPVYAEYVASTGQLVVANYDGSSVSIIDVSLDMFGNDSPSFGTVVTVPVGHHPSGLTVFPDGTRAYVVNQQDKSISIIDLKSHLVVKQIDVMKQDETSGIPRSIASTADSSTNSIFTKVYVASPNFSNLEIIEHRNEGGNTAEFNYVNGMILDVRVSSQIGGVTGTMNFMSRLPGAGQPCNLPDFSTGTTDSIATCQSLQ